MKHKKQRYIVPNTIAVAVATPSILETSFDDNTNNTGTNVVDNGGSGTGAIYVDAKRKRMNRRRDPWARYKARSIWGD